MARGHGLVTLLVVLGWTIAAPGYAQTAVDLAGVVLDQAGDPLPEAAIVVISEETNLVRHSTTDAAGRFAVPALPLGRYRVTAEAAGFSARTLHDVELSVGSALRLQFILPVGDFADTVTVEAAAPSAAATTAALSGVVSREAIDTYPVNGRDFLSFSLLLPGVATDRTPQQGVSVTSGLTFAGQRARSNNIMLDGFDNTDSSNGSMRSVLSQDAVREFQVLAGSYSAQFGKATGGVVNIVTRSGTNVLSGGAFLFLRDETLNAREHFERFTPSGTVVDRPKASFGQTQVGGTVGGPLRRDSTFFFLAAERLDVQAQNFVNINDRDQVSLFGQPAGTAADILRRAGFPVEVGNVPFAVESTTVFTKLSQHFRRGHALDVRFNWAAGLDENIEPWGGQVARSRGAVIDSDDVMAGAAYTAILAPSVVNELRSQIAFRDQNVFSLDPTCEPRCTDEGAGGPTIEVTGVASVGRQRFTPAPRRTLRYQLLDTVTLAIRGHDVKAGIDYNYTNHLSGALPLHFGGRYIFAALPAIPGILPEPVSSIQALALGLPAAYVQGYGNSESQYASQDVSIFLQDDWAIRPDVTLQLGLRYQNQFWPDMRFDTPGLGRYGFPSDTDNVAPRLGATWTPRGSERTSVHGTYGIFHDNQLTSLAGIADIVDGRTGVRTLVLPFPRSVGAWNAPGRRLPESAAGDYPSLAIAIDPALRTPYAHHSAIGVRHELQSGLALTADVLYVRGRDQVGTLDYNPIVPELGPGRRPLDQVRDGAAVPGTSASVLQYTSVGQTWYRGLTLSMRKRGASRYHVLVSYTWSMAEDDSTDYQSAFIPQDMGKGRDPGNPKGLPLGFDPASERGPSLQDQRHRLVMSGGWTLPGRLQLASIVTVGSGRPYNILAGVDLNGDGNGGAFPPDRARRIPGDPASSLTRNSGRLPMEATTDVRISRRFALSPRRSIETLFEAFNLFNRTNFTEVNNVFGTGAYPASPLPAFGEFERAAAPFQGQVAVRFGF